MSTPSPPARGAPSGARSSIWFRTLSDDDAHVLNASHELPPTAQVVIIGGGIVGLACAFSLTERGLANVVVIERDTLAARASGANAGGLWPNQQGKAPGLWKTMADAGLDRLAELAARDDFDFQFRRNGILTLIRDEAELSRAPQRVAELRAGGFAFEFVTAAQVRELEPRLAPDGLGGVFCPTDAHCNPLLLASGYARAARRKGARIVTGTEVAHLAQHATRNTLTTSRGTIECDHVICANGAWLPSLFADNGVTLPVIPARGQMLATEPLPPLVKSGVVGRYMFAQLVSGHVISGGTVELAGDDDRTTPEVIDDIWNELRRALPATERASILTTWSGLRPKTPDDLPIIGPLPGSDNVTIAAGHFKNGVLLSALTGKLVSELIVDGETSMDLSALRAERFVSP